MSRKSMYHRTAACLPAPARSSGYLVPLAPRRNFNLCWARGVAPRVWRHNAPKRGFSSTVFLCGEDSIHDLHGANKVNSSAFAPSSTPSSPARFPASGTARAFSFGAPLDVVRLREAVSKVVQDVSKGSSSSSSSLGYPIGFHFGQLRQRLTSQYLWVNWADSNDRSSSTWAYYFRTGGVVIWSDQGEAQMKNMLDFAQKFVNRSSSSAAAAEGLGTLRKLMKRSRTARVAELLKWFPQQEDDLLVGGRAAGRGASPDSGASTTSSHLHDWSESLTFSVDETNVNVTPRVSANAHLTLPPTPTPTSPTLLLGASFALDFAVRANFEEQEIHRSLQQIDQKLTTYRLELSKSLNYVFFVRRVSALQKRIFQLEVGTQKLLHRLEQLRSNADVVDLLWESGEAEKLYEHCAAHFDLQSRLGKLARELNHTTESCRTHNEHVRHGHSAQLETLIIYLIALEILLFVGDHWKLFKRNGLLCPSDDSMDREVMCAAR